MSVNVNRSPKVACIMVTSGNPWRQKLAGVALRSFADQSYQPSRLFIVNHGEAKLLAGTLGAWYKDHPIEEHKVPVESLGNLRNKGIQLAKEWGAEYAVSWDDDDWSNRLRLEMQLEAAMEAGPGFASTLRGYTVYDLAKDRMWVRDQGKYEFRGAPGLTLFPLDNERTYEDRPRHEDSHFARQFLQEGKLRIVDDMTLYVRSGHHENVSGFKHVLGRWPGDRELKATELRDLKLEGVRDLYHKTGCLGPQPVTR